MTRSLISLALLGCLTLPAFAADAAMGAKDPPAVTGITYVSIMVEDQDAAMEWYVTNLGCKVTMDEVYGENGERWLTVTLPGQAETDFPQLVLFKPDHKQEAALGYPLTLPATNIALSTNDCAGMSANLEAAGATILQQPEDKGYGIESVWMDPFGNYFVMIESTWNPGDPMPDGE